MPRGYASNVTSTCGVGVWYGFNNPDIYAQSLNDFGGIDYNIAGFIESPNCKKVYNYIKEKHTIVFQSPVKRNRNSGRQFFFVVFKKGK